MAPRIRTPLLLPFQDLLTCMVGVKGLLHQWGTWDIPLLGLLWGILEGHHLQAIPTTWGHLDRLPLHQDHRTQELHLLYEEEGHHGMGVAHHRLMVQGISPLQGICHLPLHTWEAMLPHLDHLLTILLLVSDTRITFQNGNGTGNLLTET